MVKGGDYLLYMVDGGTFLPYMVKVEIIGFFQVW